jgi:hypothetical protein
LADTIKVIAVPPDLGTTVSLGGVVGLLIPSIPLKVPSTFWARMGLPWPPGVGVLPGVGVGWPRPAPGPAAEADTGRTRLAASAIAANERREHAKVMCVILLSRMYSLQA